MDMKDDAVTEDIVVQVFVTFASYFLHKWFIPKRETFSKLILKHGFLFDSFQKNIVCPFCISNIFLKR